jgi:hypothetical protein
LVKIEKKKKYFPWKYSSTLNTLFFNSVLRCKNTLWWCNPEYDPLCKFSVFSKYSNYDREVNCSNIVFSVKVIIYHYSLCILRFSREWPLIVGYFVLLENENLSLFSGLIIRCELDGCVEIERCEAIDILSIWSMRQYNKIFWATSGFPVSSKTQNLSNFKMINRNIYSKSFET